MTTEGFEGLYLETRNYGATTAFWKSLGFESEFETDHGSGQLRHPSGGPYVFINEQHGADLETYPILGVADSTTFAPARAAEYASPFAPTHWGMTQAFIVDPDGRRVNLQAPLPEGVEGPDADAHHQEKYGSA